MKKVLLLIFLGLFLVSCGDSAEEKNTKRICVNFSKKINLDKNKCYKDKEYFKELIIEHNVILQTEEIENFNKNVENFNKIDVEVDKINYELVDIEAFAKQNNMSSEKNQFRISDDNINKKIKFSSYFEIKNTDENSQEYVIYFEDTLYKLVSALQDKKYEPKTVSGAKFQNVEVKKKLESIMFQRFYGLKKFEMPLNNSNSIIYGYFGNTNITGIDAIMKGFELTDNTNIENQIVIFSEFYIEDIKLEKIKYTEQQVRDFLKRNKMRAALLDLK